MGSAGSLNFECKVGGGSGAAAAAAAVGGGDDEKEKQNILLNCEFQVFRMKSADKDVHIMWARKYASELYYPTPKINTGFALYSCTSAGTVSWSRLLTAPMRSQRASRGFTCTLYATAFLYSFWPHVSHACTGHRHTMRCHA